MELQKSAALCFVLFSLVWSSPVFGAGWETIANEDGVKVTTKDVPGRSLPVFQGTGVVAADIYHVLAVISDVPRHCEWRPKCSGVRLIERVGPQELVMWSLNDAPWPVSDRDVVIRAKVSFDLQKNVIWSRFRRTTHPKMPPKDGVVRVPHIEGFYKLQRLGPAKTRVTYRVNADPGGWVPKWVAARTSRGLPLKTIRGLRKQVKRTKYDAFIAKWRKIGEPPKPAPSPAPNAPSNPPEKPAPSAE